MICIFYNDLTEESSRATSAEVELKKSVSDGKTLVANAITAKGVATAVDAAFATMAANIANIKTDSSFSWVSAYNARSTYPATSSSGQSCSVQVALDNATYIVIRLHEMINSGSSVSGSMSGYVTNVDLGTGNGITVSKVTMKYGTPLVVTTTVSAGSGDAYAYLRVCIIRVN